MASANIVHNPIVRQERERLRALAESARADIAAQLRRIPQGVVDAGWGKGKAWLGFAHHCRNQVRHQAGIYNPSRCNHLIGLASQLRRLGAGKTIEEITCP